MSRLSRALSAAALLTLGALGGAATSALAGGHGGPGGPGGPGLHHFARAMAGLDLTEAQMQEMVDLRDDLRDEMIEAHRAQKGEADAVLAQLEAGKVDRAALHARVDAAAKARTEVAHEALDRVLDVYDSLTPAQKAELVSTLKEHKAKAEAWREAAGDDEGPGDHAPRGRR
jgi:Spy/CpxP family protein refolding chaperone